MQSVLRFVYFIVRQLNPYPFHFNIWQPQPLYYSYYHTVKPAFGCIHSGRQVSYSPEITIFAKNLGIITGTMAHKSGFVNIIGNPNVGKSTLMNAMVAVSYR